MPNRPYTPSRSSAPPQKSLIRRGVNLFLIALAILFGVGKILRLTGVLQRNGGTSVAADQTHEQQVSHKFGDLTVMTPASWKVMPPPDPRIQYAMNHGHPNGLFGVRAIPVPKTLTLEMLASSPPDTNAEGNTKLTSISQTTLSGQPAVQALLDTDLPDGHLLTRVFYLLKNSQVYLLTFSTTAERFDAAEPTYRLVAESAQIKTIAPAADVPAPAIAQLPKVAPAPTLAPTPGVTPKPAPVAAATTKPAALPSAPANVAEAPVAIAPRPAGALPEEFNPHFYSLPPNTICTEIQGTHTGGGPMLTTGDGKLPVLGFRVKVDEFMHRVCLRTFEPLYERPKVPAEKGETFLIAKEGYAVGALTINSGEFVNAVCVTFMKLTDTGVDPAANYSPPWVGKRIPGMTTKKIGGDGQRVVGIVGRKGLNVDTLGLVIAANK